MSDREERRTDAGDLARETWAVVRDILEAERARWSRGLADLGLTTVQAHTLDEMAGLPPTLMSALAHRLHVDPSWVTGVIDQLERRGDAQRRPSPSDRRVKLLELTEQGRRTHLALRRLTVEAPPALTCLPARDLRELLRIARAVAAGWDRP